MINEKDNPLEWSELLFELEDLQEHLSCLVSQMTNDGFICAEDYSTQIAHLYAHLNRSWNSRHVNEEQTESRFEKLTQFPKDIEPYG